MRHIFILFLLISVRVPAQDTLTVERLDYKFVSIDQGVILPITRLESTDVGGFFVSCLEPMTLELCGPEDLTIWADGRFVSKKENTECVYFSAEELCQLIARDTMYLSIVSNTSLSGVTARSIRISDNSREDYPELRTTGGNDLLGFILGWALILGLSYSAPIKFKQGFRVNFNQYTLKPLALPQLLQLVTSIVLGSFVWSFQQSGGIPSFTIALIAQVSAWAILGILYALSSRLFGLKTVLNWQAVFHVRAWLMFTVGFFMLQTVDALFFSFSTTNSVFLNAAIVYSVSALMIIKISILTSYRGVKSLHLFIYLCTTEILPAILVIHTFWK